jgi:hypothetical protein
MSSGTPIARFLSSTTANAGSRRDSRESCIFARMDRARRDRSRSVSFAAASNFSRGGNGIPARRCVARSRISNCSFPRSFISRSESASEVGLSRASRYFEIPSEFASMPAAWSRCWWETGGFAPRTVAATTSTTGLSHRCFGIKGRFQGSAESPFGRSQFGKMRGQRHSDTTRISFFRKSFQAAIDTHLGGCNIHKSSKRMALFAAARTLPAPFLSRRFASFLLP